MHYAYAWYVHIPISNRHKNLVEQASSAGPSSVEDVDVGAEASMKSLVTGDCSCDCKNMLFYGDKTLECGQ